MSPLESARTDAARVRRFHDLYRGEFAFVWSAARHLGVPPGEVDDVVQDVFLTAYRRLDQLRFEVSPRAWLFGVTRRVAFRYRRGGARRVRRHAALAALDRPAGDSPHRRRDDAEELDRLLARLGAGNRVVWEMTEVLGMSAPEIASELGLPLNTVYSRLRLARQQLQALVADPGLLGAWRDAARERDAPPREAERRTWGLLLPVLGEAGAGAGLAGWATARAALATIALAAGVAAVGLSGARDPGPKRRDAAPPAPVQARALGPSPAPASPAPELAPAPAAAATATPPRRTRSGPEGPLEAGARLAEEVALLDRAQAQLGASEAAAALATLAEHARRFPAGALADVREAARVDALCRRRDASAAEAAARRLVHEHPASAVAQRFANFRCAGDGSPGTPETKG